MPGQALVTDVAVVGPADAVVLSQINPCGQSTDAVHYIDQL